MASPEGRHHYHHLQVLGLLARSVLQHEASLGIMITSFHLSRVPACCTILSCRTRVYIQGFLLLDRLSTMGKESCLPAT
jgi:hypothetical protein